MDKQVEKRFVKNSKRSLGRYTLRQIGKHQTMMAYLDSGF